MQLAHLHDSLRTISRFQTSQALHEIHDICTRPRLFACANTPQRDKTQDCSYHNRLQRKYWQFAKRNSKSSAVTWRETTSVWFVFRELIQRSTKFNISVVNVVVFIITRGAQLRCGKKGFDSSWCQQIIGNTFQPIWQRTRRKKTWLEDPSMSLGD